jgi:hypothetical protein
MPTPKIAIRFPRQLLLEMRGAAHRESLKRGYTVTWVQLMVELAERYVRRDEQGAAAATVTG